MIIYCEIITRDNDIEVININFKETDKTKCKYTGATDNNSKRRDLLCIVMDNCCGQNKNKIVI